MRCREVGDSNLLREFIGELSNMRIVSSKSGVTKMVVITLAVIIAVGGVVAAYIMLKSPSLSPTPSYTHTVDYTTMMNPRSDYWNITVTKPYEVILNDSMTVSSVNQYLMITGLSSSIMNVWTVLYRNSTYFQYVTWDANGNQVDSGWLNCNNGIVKVVVTATTITFTGASSFTSNILFKNLGEVWTANSDGAFNGGELYMILTIT
jgi:hypothetical protein